MLLCAPYMNDTLLYNDDCAKPYNKNAETDTPENGYSAEHRARALNNLFAEQRYLDNIKSNKSYTCFKVWVCICMLMIAIKICMDIYLDFIMMKTMNKDPVQLSVFSPVYSTNHAMNRTPDISSYPTI